MIFYLHVISVFAHLNLYLFTFSEKKWSQLFYFGITDMGNTMSLSGRDIIKMKMEFNAALETPLAVDDE
jgi:hypothetical protein